MAPFPAVSFKNVEVITNRPTACASKIGIPKPS